MIKKLRTHVVLALAALTTLAAGCATEGTATSETTGSALTAQTSNASTSTKTSSNGNLLANFDPCAAVESVAAELGLTEVEAIDEKECAAEYPTKVSVSLTKQPKLAIGDAVGETKSDIAIGTRKAKLVKKPASKTSCMVSVEVTPASRVDITAISDNSLDAACEAATKVATAIEPELPK